MATFYFSQAGAGLADGTSYANSASASAFNASTYQSDGDICYLAGTFTEQLQIKNSNLEVRSYSADPFVLEGADTVTRGIYCTGTGYTITVVKLYDLTVRNCTLQNIYIDSNVNSLTSVIIDNCTTTGAGRTYSGAADTTTGTGILLVNNNYLKSITGISVTNCTSTDNGKHGFDFRGACAGTVSDCYAARNGATNTGHGFHTNAAQDDITVSSGWTNTSGTIYSRTALGGYTVTDVMVTEIDTVRNWLVSAGASTTPADGQFSQNGTTVYINVGVNPSTCSGIRFCYADTTSDLSIVDCIAEYNIDLNGVEGMGFSLDNAVYNGKLKRCISRYNEGDGLSLYDARNCAVESFVSHHNGRQGFYYISLVRDCALYHCASAFNGTGSYWFPRAINPTVKNCIGFKDGVGVTNASGFRLNPTYTTGLVESGNFAYGCGENGTENFVNMTGTEADPLFLSSTDFRLKPTSPCIRTGAGIDQYTHYGADGIAFRKGTPSIGAYEQEFRTTITMASGL